MQNLTGLLPLLALFALMYFMMIRPQQRAARERKAMLSALQRGDRVVTVGGIHGTIVDLDEAVVTLKIAENTLIKVNRGAVGGILKG